METGKVVTFARSDLPLPVSGGVGPGGVYLSDVMQVGTTVEMKEIPGGGFTMVRGFVNADFDGTLDVFQGWNLADINAISTTSPAAGASNSRLLLNTFPFVSVGGVLSPGIPFIVAIAAPFVRVRYTNNAVDAQTIFRIHFEVAE